MSKEQAILAKLFSGSDAGYFTLPKELIARREAERRVSEASRTLSAQMVQIRPDEVRTRIAAEVVKAADKGDVPPGVGREFGEEQERLRVLSLDHAILSDARQALQDGPLSVWYLAASLSEDILADHLRPAMNDVLEAVRSGADLAPAIPWGNQMALMRTGEEVRDYYQLVAVAVDRHAAIRDAQQRLRLLTGSPSTDAFDMFGQLRNMHALWPMRRSNVDSIRGKAPWPDDPFERMVWLVTSEAEPWMPTAVECEDAYDALVQANPLRLVTV